METDSDLISYCINCNKMAVAFLQPSDALSPVEVRVAAPTPYLSLLALICLSYFYQTWNTLLGLSVFALHRRRPLHPPHPE